MKRRVEESTPVLCRRPSWSTIAHGVRVGVAALWRSGESGVDAGRGVAVVRVGAGAGGVGGRPRPGRDGFADERVWRAVRSRPDLEALSRRGVAVAERLIAVVGSDTPDLSSMS